MGVPQPFLQPLVCRLERPATHLCPNKELRPLTVEGGVAIGKSLPARGYTEWAFQAPGGLLLLCTPLVGGVKGRQLYDADRKIATQR